MKPKAKKCLAALSVAVLMIAHPTATNAQTASSDSSSHSNLSPQDAGETQTTTDAVENPVLSLEGPFAQWGIPTPPGAEGYEVNEVSDNDLSPQGLDEWHPTDDPQSEIIPGQMRSDKEDIPAGASKADADQAEIKEAKLTDPGTPTLNARPGCGVYWPVPFEVCGAIKNLYDAIGGPTSFLLLPKSKELTNPDGVGKRSEFVNGFIYWHPRTGAHSVSIPVSRVWQRHGWENGFLGYPTTSDISLGNQWYAQHFEGGHVYTHNALPATQASIQGAIYDKWQSMGGHTSALGFPISDELTTPDGIGRYNVFEGGMIYWTPQHGAHPVSGPILLEWASSGYERGKYGYPVTDPIENANGLEMEQKFEHGTLNGFAEVIQKIIDATPGAVGKLLPKEVYEDGIAYAKSIKQDVPIKVFEQALKDLLAYNEQYARENVSLQAGLPEGGDSDPVNPRNRGDIFYSDATTARVNHGHNGIFVGDPNAGDFTKNDTVEASGHIDVGSSSGEDDPNAGVKRRQNLENDDPRRTSKPRLRNPQYFTVNTSQEARNEAADWALRKAGQRNGDPGAGYNYNFAFNKDIEADRFNCSSLVWAAYMAATNGVIDLDADGGPGVYPSDVRDDDQVSPY